VEFFVPPSPRDVAHVLRGLKYDFTLPTARNTVFKIGGTVCENTRRPIDKWEERRMNEVEGLVVQSKMPIFFY
jgi:alkylated DNA nucleotide flippase Atl1